MHPHIYVINLRRRTDRHELFLSNWEAAGLSKEQLTWIDAVDGRTLTDFSGYKGVAKGDRRAAQYGCFLSHTTAIQTAIKNKHFPILILEDDAVVTGSVNLSSILANAPEKLLYLGGLPVRRRTRVTEYGKHAAGFHALETDIRMYGGHAYALPTAAVAQHVLTHLLKYPCAFDSSLVRYQRMYAGSVAVHSPFLFYQAKSFSDIEGVVRWS
jgi:GR25 family glycosyltransferase involved in LPS biosynthesis